MKFIALPFFLVALILGCNNKQNAQYPFDAFTYQVSFRNEVDLIIQQAILKTDTSGVLYATITLRNEAIDPTQFYFSDWELESASGLRSLPVNATDSVIRLEPESQRTFILFFNPTNSLKLFRLTGLKGDLCQQYRLIHKQNALNIAFTLSDEQYRSYKERWGIEKDVDVFLINNRSDFIEEELTYLNNKISLNHDEERVKHDVRLSEQEILVDGLNSNLSAYTYRDTLIVKIKLINHSPFVVSIEPTELKILLNSLAVPPLESGNLKRIELPKSQRAFMESKYLLTTREISEFTLDISSLNFLISKSVPVLYDGKVTFRKVKI